ncbi:uncharacterized protein LOC129951725 [Eupeodes corollae]|uniref:uncharacterized protein LOC129951725 n=1 Tax=Eupeodes corollae TaxID=290404 RepID=UPI002492052B|nr:uncharacterized protein LOC129951725 [Eupeodes corollae]
MQVQLLYQTLVGLTFILSLGYASSKTTTDSSDGRIQNDDDYEYSDDESVPSSHTKFTEASPTSGMVPFFRKANITIKTIAGKNAILECPVENLSDQNVVLWYKDANALTTGSSVLNKDYSLNTNNFSLKIMNVTVANQGEYYCEIQPQRIRLHTTLIVTEDPIETIIPESSKSSQESIHFKLSTILMKSSVIGIFLFLRI